MNKKEIIEQLQSLRAHCRSMINTDPEIFKTDVEALDYAINLIKGEVLETEE